MITEIVCEECGEQSDRETAFCPSCGEENPWNETAKFEFDEDDLPVTFAVRAYDDNWGLWHGFCEEYFGERLHAEDIAGLPDGDEFPNMKFHEVELFWILDEDLNVRGPFLSEEEAQSVLNSDNGGPRPPA